VRYGDERIGDDDGEPTVALTPDRRLNTDAIIEDILGASAMSLPLSPGPAHLPHTPRH
jgi:hypothetical protein